MDNWLGWYMATLERCTLKYLDGVKGAINWFESEMTGGDKGGPAGAPPVPGTGSGGLGSEGPPQGKPPTAAERYWTVHFDIENPNDTPVTLRCAGCRKIGGGPPIAGESIQFVPAVAQPGSNSVQILIDMTGQPVGLWTGTIVSREQPNQQLAPEPLMPTWAH